MSHEKCRETCTILNKWCYEHEVCGVMVGMIIEYVLELQIEISFRYSECARYKQEPQTIFILSFLDAFKFTPLVNSTDVGTGEIN